MEIHCTASYAVRAVTLAFAAGATLGGVLTGCTLDTAAPQQPPPVTTAAQAAWSVPDGDG